MKILMLIDGLAKGGKERRLLELIKGLKLKEGIEAELVLFSRKIHYQHVFDLGINIHFLERKPKKDPRVFVRLIKLCKEVQPDILHSWGSMPSIYAIPAAKLLNITFINAMITSAPIKLALWDHRYLRSRLTFPFSDLIVSNSLAGLKSYGVSQDKGYCLYNGFDFARVNDLKDPEEIREQFAITTPYVVGMVGAFEDRKDYHTYLQGAMKVLDKRKDVTFLAIGGGKNLALCKEIVLESYKPYIIFTGMQNQVESIINAVDIGVLMTNNDVHGEGISNAVMEFMALEKPVVASDSGGTKEIVVDGKTGWLIPSKSPNTMAEKIVWLLENKKKAVEMGQLGKERVWAMFNLDDMVNKYVQLYKTALKVPSREVINVNS